MKQEIFHLVTKYRKELFVGIIVFLFLLFKDIINSLIKSQ